MAPWARRTSKPIPSISSPTTDYELNDYSLGMDSFTGNDKFPIDNGGTNLWRLAQDARIITLGEYGTRKGFDYHSDAAGETQDQAQTSTTGAADQAFSETTYLAVPFTSAQTAPLTKLEVRLKNTSGTGTVLIELWTNSGGSPGTLISRSSIAASAITGSYQYLTARFPDAPSLTNTTQYWIVAHIQSTGSNSYSWSSTTSATTAKTSTDSGVIWSATTYSLNFKQHYATLGGVKGLIRATKSDGTKITIFAHGTTVYSVDDVTGALTVVKSGLSANATKYRFVVVNDVLRYVNGYDGYRKWDFTTESQVNATNYTNICEHKGLIFLNRSDDPNRWDFSNFADYETFTSTDFIYVPAPKTGDPSTAACSLNGYLLIWTLNNKYILSGDDNATFRLDSAPDQKGTYTQETVTYDDNYAYYLSDDGVYQTNGTQPKLLSENNYDEILTLANKDDACLIINRGRLYLYYQSAGSSTNDLCYVWNLNFAGKRDTIESADTSAYVAVATSSPHDNNNLLVGSSKVGQVYWQELDSNDYCNLGGDINFLLQTHYNPYRRPSIFKQVRFWKARFAAQSGNYTILCEYAYDLRDNWQVAENGYVNTQADGYLWGAASTIWGSFTWGSSATKEADMYVPGEYKRIALRYKHYGARQPHTFLGHTQIVQSRRIR